MDQIIGRYVAIYPCDLEVHAVINIYALNIIFHIIYNTVADGCHQHHPG